LRMSHISLTIGTKNAHRESVVRRSSPGDLRRVPTQTGDIPWKIKIQTSWSQGSRARKEI
jgi:hypothetical protein